MGLSLAIQSDLTVSLAIEPDLSVTFSCKAQVVLIHKQTSASPPHPTFETITTSAFETTTNSSLQTSLFERNYQPHFF
jgi:hypothetical protein